MAHDDTAVNMDDVFKREPASWGLRGDPHVWRALREHLSGQDIPGSADEVASLLNRGFTELVGLDLLSYPASSVYVERYARGGMSSGMVDLDTWRRRLMPLLVKRAQRLLEAPQ
ncbi:hypothetical protein Rhe02_78350 [Rhizocola hellebori]|uniref:Uncharacterized protein n=1 Tax=Rhizocola hellebori TaxID=1392758 RepID=A0A8J3QF74_9ACTN|nr:hypothetical protein Rhe02_78350 [Rhizocola hellebori]